MGRGKTARTALVLGLAGLLSCTAAPPVPEAPGPRRVDGWERLDRSVVPRRYDLVLNVDPRTPRFSGEVSIEVELSRPTREIVLHGEGLSIRSATVVQGGRTDPARPIPGEHGGLLLALDAELPAGPARLELVWDAPLREVSQGLYRVLDRERWYAFTQFQPLSARRVFPCFDQPEFKTPFRVKLRVPRHMTAVSSGPMVSRVTRDEQRTFIFDETRPIPTYLLALAVGEFDAVPVPESAGGPPMRILTPHGRADLARFAARRTPPLLDYLVEWFGRPMPFAKLDQLAVPEFAFGAMENVGLVTYREQRLLFEPELGTYRDRLWTEVTIAHELAHMWFGNWVTPAWWDDLWLNEAFATWMQTKAVDAVSPALEAGLESASHGQYVMYLDSKRDARAVRQPIRHGGDVYNAFDGITYGKGAAVLRMAEAWVGEEAFREGVRSYLNDHAYGSGGTPELLAALDAASDAPVSRVVRGFVDRPGTPLVTAELDCSDASPAVTLEQRRYQPAGRPADGPPWVFPVCVRWSEGRECFLLETERETFPLPADGCPAWIHPNAEETGYYRWSLAEAPLGALFGERLSELTRRERLALPGGLRALLEADEISTDTYLDGLLALSADDHRRMAEAIVPGLWSLWRLVSDEEAEDYARFARRVLGPYLEAIGLVPAVSESRDASLLRSRLVPALAAMGGDPAIRARARRAADAFLAGATPDFTAEEIRVLVPLASWDGDAAHWERLRAALDEADAPARRRILVSALGAFDDPTLAVRSLDLVLDGTLRANEWGAVGSVRRAARPAAWAWLKRHHDAVAARLGPMRSAGLPRVGSRFCSQAEYDDVKRFFEGLSPQAGRGRNLALALEDVERCVQARETLLPAMRSWLARLPR